MKSSCFRTALRSAMAGACILGGLAINAQSWQPLAHTAPFGANVPFLLTDGSVMVGGWENGTWFRLTPDASGSYVNGTWTQLATMPSDYQPLYYASAVLADGRVICIGGEYNPAGSGFTNRGCIYNPLTNTWTNIPPPTGWTSVGDAQCAVLQDGKFMLANPIDTRQAIFDPATSTWTAVGTGKTDRFDEEGWCLLPDTTFLTVCCTNLPHAEKYIPWTQTWISAGNTPVTLPDAGSQEVGPMIMMYDGRVLACGGTTHNATYTPPADPFQPGTWTTQPDFPGGTAMADAPAVLLPNGNVLCMSSPGVFGQGVHAYEFNYTTNTWLTEPNFPRANVSGETCYKTSMLMLPTGQVLLTDWSNDIEIYTPTGGPNNAWRPVLSYYPNAASAGGTAVYQGMQFNGLSQCNYYGDDMSNAENYPLVRITNNATGHVQYCRTHDHSTMSIATGAAIVSTHVNYPASLELGASTVEVVTNGIPSQTYPITVYSKTIAGATTFQSLVSAAIPGRSVTFEIRAPGSSTSLDTKTTTVDTTGNYVIGTNLPDGTYDITAKASHWLRRKLANVNVVGGFIAGVNFSLINGDVDGDNVVGLADFAALKLAFASSAGDPNWNPNADLNGDGVVSLADFAILKANFGINGDS